jgi:hypothetical protein
MSERRFSEEEVAEILKNAAEAEHSNRNLPSAKGLTLRELTDIGREVGISARAVQNAAQRMDTPEIASRKFFGFPIGVSRTIELERKLTDDEWDQLVANLRQTFDARGVVRQEGSLKSWSNGNLQALLEPTPTGQRLRLRTLKGDARGYIGGGIGMFALGSTVFTTAAISGALDDRGFIAAVGLLIAGGIGMFSAGALGLPRWARLRRAQMDAIADQLRKTEMPDLIEGE